ncbi:MAG TPA: glycosyltransferase family 1 protein [Rhizomicrobium sp.]
MGQRSNLAGEDGDGRFRFGDDWSSLLDVASRSRADNPRDDSPEFAWNRLDGKTRASMPGSIDDRWADTNRLTPATPRPFLGEISRFRSRAGMLQEYDVRSQGGTAEKQLPAEQSSYSKIERPLRIALVASSYNYIQDGVALTLNRLVAYLERQAVKVLVFAPVGKFPALSHHGTLVPVPSVPLPARPEYRLAFGLPRRAVQRLGEFRPDIIHIALAPDLLGYSTLRIARNWNVPVVASYHTRYETYLKHYWYAAGMTSLLRCYLRRSYGYCREVYVPSQCMMDALTADGFKNNLRLWPRGVDPSSFNPDKRSRRWRDKWGIGENEIVVTYVSRLVREKQLGTLVAVLRLLEQSGAGYRYVIVGDGPERAVLERQLPNVVFTGFLNGDELGEAYASSDIFLFPSETETFGNVTLEAMASGLPCVCADATGSRSLVVHDLCGYLAKPGCAREFADRISALARDPDLRRRMGAAARKRSLGFSWDEAMARMLGYYRSLVAETSA